MSIEQDTFFHYLIQPEKLLSYGFEPDGKTLGYEEMLPEENFKICLRFDGEIKGRILDLATGEEYTNFRVESSTGFGAEVRRKFTALLEDIRDKCCRNQYFRSEQGRRKQTEEFARILTTRKWGMHQDLGLFFNRHTSVQHGLLHIKVHAPHPFNHIDAC